MSKNEISYDTPLSYLTAGQLVELIKKIIPNNASEKSIPDIYGLDVLIEISGYSKASIYAKTSRGEIPHFKRDGKLFFRHNEIVAWMTSNKIETKTEFSQRMDTKLMERARR